METKQTNNQLKFYPFKQLTFQVFFQKKTKEELTSIFGKVDDDFINWLHKNNGKIEDYPLFEYYKLITSSIYHTGHAPEAWDLYYPLVMPRTEIQ